MEIKHQQALKDEKARYVKYVEDHQANLKELKKSHDKQCEELGREILKQKLEADRLHNELMSNGIQVPRKALFSDDASTVPSRSGRVSQFVKTCVLLVVAACLTRAHQANMFTKSGLCSPVMPGTVLDDTTNDTTLRSPWWVPDSYKQQAFDNFCADDDQATIQPATVEWEKEGRLHKLTVSVGGKVQSKRKAIKAEVLSDRVRVWKRNGYAEEEMMSW